MKRKRQNKDVPVDKTDDDAYSASVDQVLSYLAVNHWDVVIVGDGSGATWNSACGWASVLVDKRSGLRKTFVGAMNAGTTYIAELLPYVQAISWYVQGPGREYLKDSSTVRPLKIHIITDNQTIAQQGTGQIKTKKTDAIWAILRSELTEDYKIHWHWLSRNSIALNNLCDWLASKSRKSIEAVNSSKIPDGKTSYDFNKDNQVD